MRYRGMRRRRAAWALLVACVAALATCASGDLDAQAAVRSPLLVSLLDGTVHAVDPATGESLWSFSSGGPLVRAHARPTRGEWDRPPGDAPDAVALRPTRGGPAVVFPGVDGALYALSSESPNALTGDETKAAVARLPVTARQLVDASPSMTRDGALVLGTRTSVVFALDAERGVLLRTFTAEGVVMHASPADTDADADVRVFALDAAAAEDAASPELAGAVFVGRTEYKVRSVDATTGAERWNVTYSEVHPLTAPGPRGAATLVARASGLDRSTTSDLNPKPSLPALRFERGNALTMRGSRDDSSGREQPDDGVAGSKTRRDATKTRTDGWSRTFPSTPLSAFESFGARGSARRGDSGGPEVFVGAHAGGLYALPGPSLESRADGNANAPKNAPSSSARDDEGLITLLRRDGFGETETPVALAPRATEDDWACVPEALAAAALATRGRPFLDGALWGYAPNFGRGRGRFLDGDAFAGDFERRADASSGRRDDYVIVSRGARGARRRRRRARPKARGLPPRRSPPPRPGRTRPRPARRRGAREGRSEAAEAARAARASLPKRWTTT